MYKTRSIHHAVWYIWKVLSLYITLTQLQFLLSNIIWGVGVACLLRGYYVQFIVVTLLYSFPRSWFKIEYRLAQDLHMNRMNGAFSVWGSTCISPTVFSRLSCCSIFSFLCVVLYEVLFIVIVSFVCYNIVCPSMYCYCLFRLL